MTAQMPDNTPRERAYGLPCPFCATINIPDDSRFAEYFSSGQTLCPRCSRGFDFWRAALEQLREWPVSETAFQLLGATVTVVSARLEPERTVDLDLSPRIPAGAEILLAGVTAGGLESGPPTWPALMLLQHQLVLDPLPLRIQLYGAALGNRHARPVEASVIAFWVAPGPDEVPLHQLADAAKQYAAERYTGVVIPANIAAESALTPAITAWVRTYCSREDTDEFMGPRGATYGHQLKVLTRIAGRALSIPPLPNAIRSLLNDLRQYRNDLGHRGVLDNPKRPPPNREKAAAFLTAAVFGYRYARYLQKSVANCNADSPSIPAGPAGLDTDQW